MSTHPLRGPVVDDAALRDASRLRAVIDTQLLDTADEEAFDRWARRAADATTASAALLSIVDGERSFFKSFRLRDGSAGEARQVPIEDSLCRELVVRDEPFIIEDAANDPRTAGYAAVGAFPVGAYAGIPVRSADGHVLGSFCVVDGRPRPWATGQLAALRDFAAAVEAEIRLRTARRGQRRLRLLLDTHHLAHELMMDGAPSSRILAGLASGVEGESDGLIASILLLDDDGKLRHGAAPSLPPAWWRRFDGIPCVAGNGSCAAAVGSGQAVFVSDIHSDAAWAVLRDDAIAQALAASWSMPIRGGSGRVLGSFALYARERRGPTAWELELLTQAARLAAIAIERDRAEGELLTLATRDPLTGLPNRTWLLQDLETRLRANQERGRDLAVLFCDLDRFKMINDSLGHETGDAVLAEIGRRLAGALGPEDAVARLGGDEFVVVPGADHDERTAATLADRLATAFAAPIVDRAGRSHRLGVSIGVALVRGISASEAIRRADSAMYAVKRSQKRVGTYSAAVDHERCEEARMVDALRDALDDGELHVVYQPVVELSGERIVGFEALLRWHSPELGNVSPARFIPLAEQHHLIAPIGTWVLESAVRQVSEWSRRFGRPLRMSVNLSVVQFADPALPDQILALLADAGVDPALLHVEITETTVLADEAATMRTLERLRSAGVGVLLDDFGTGFSSLTHLRTLPIDGIKIDRSFVADLDDGRRNRPLVSGLIQLAESLGLIAIAEGIETHDQAQTLRFAGCAFGQGYLFARPDGPEAIERLVAAGEGEREAVPLATPLDSGPAAGTRRVEISRP